MSYDNDAAFLDANVPIYADGTAHHLKEPCVRVLDRIARGALPAVTSAEVLQEVLNHLMRSGRKERGAPFLQRLSSLVSEVLPVTGDNVVQAAELALRYPTLPTRDLVHLAVMQNHNITTIVSTDVHFDQVSGIVRIDPRKA